MKVGFTGTQRGMTPQQIQALTEVLSVYLPGVFHHGDCIGADAEAYAIARSQKFRIVCHPPIVSTKRAWCVSDEDRDPKPYLVRNHDIVDETDILLAAPGEGMEKLRSGTWATIRYTYKVCRPVRIIFPDGTGGEKRGWWG
jgi:hypothetical protein